jgi:hypothetical protein
MGRRTKGEAARIAVHAATTEGLTGRLAGALVLGIVLAAEPAAAEPPQGPHAPQAAAPRTPHARAPRPDRFRATTSVAAQQSAVRAIPYAKLDEDAKQKVSSVLRNFSIFRRMPIRVTRCDPDMYLFLVEHPDVVVNIWDVLGISQMGLQQIDDDTYKLTDEYGTEGTVQFLYRSHDTHVAYTEGSFNGPFMLKPAKGRGVLILKSGYVLETDGRYYVTSRLDAFVQIDNGGLELLSKAFQPIIGRVVDSNFTQTAGFVGSLSRTAEVNCPGMKRLAGKLSGVKPEVREEFATVSEEVAEKAAESERTATVPRVSSRPLPAAAEPVLDGP